MNTWKLGLLSNDDGKCTKCKWDVKLLIKCYKKLVQSEFCCSPLKKSVFVWWGNKSLNVKMPWTGWVVQNVIENYKQEYKSKHVNEMVQNELTLMRSNKKLPEPPPPPALTWTSPPKGRYLLSLSASSASDRSSAGSGPFPPEAAASWSSSSSTSRTLLLPRFASSLTLGDWKPPIFLLFHTSQSRLCGGVLKCCVL